MSTYLPVVLTGRTLGDRHRQLNALVEEAFRKNVDFSSLENAAETSPLDRLFKIDLASKYQIVTYTLKNLKDEDMLYVNRALKCKWLLEPKHSDIINPIYLEQVLFPEMLTTSVNKMKKWIYMHLRDPQRCQQFYEYFVDKNNDLAMNFFWHCSNEFILRKAENLFVKMTPQQLKLMVEKCPQIAKLYFESLHDKGDIIIKYRTNESEYYNSLKCLLKTDIDLFLDITEKHFNVNIFPRLSSDATKFIMINRKTRFLQKPELYTAYVLDVGTLATYLSIDEIKDIIVKMARAEYINTWFSYKNIEPLIKQLKSDDRVQFKKQIFVDKLFGGKVQEWPYTIPYPPVIEPLSDELFSLDKIHDPRCYETYSDSYRGFRRILKKRKCGKWTEMAGKSSFDMLFDRFRFQNFDQTFQVLRKEILATSAIEHRMHMMLVLVSKSGGRADNVQDLLKWLVAHHSNEVITLRAATVRSLVKRAAVWRVPEISWQLLLQFARGLGLDGTECEAECTEGLHAVIIRNVLSSTNSTLPVFEAYLRAFSSLSEYPLTTQEKNIIKERLPALLLAAAEVKINDDTGAASELIVKVLNVLKAYSVPADSYAIARALSIVKGLAQKDPASAQEPLLRLYQNRTGRKHLTRENFDYIQTEASYLNVLRHEPELITSTHIHQILRKDLRLDGFLRKLSIYFGEEKGLAIRFMEVIDKEMKAKPCVGLARPLAIIAGTSFEDHLKHYDEKPRNSIEKRIACGLKANAYVARPKFDLDQYGWPKAGVKAIANKVIVCSAATVSTIVERLLVWRRAARLALRLAIRGGLEASAFSSIAKTRPTVALKLALSYMRGKENNSDILCIWNSVKPIITTIDLSSRKYLQKSLSKVDSMPNLLRAEYVMLLYKAFRKISLDLSMPILCYIENNLPNVSHEFITTTITEEFISKEFKLELRPHMEDEYYMDRICLFVRIIAKYLLLCQSEEEQKVRMEIVGKPFLDTLKSLKSDITKTSEAIKYLDLFIYSLKYTRVYMDSSYVSCLPVLREVADWLDETFPINVWFAKHLKLTFNMLLFKAIKMIAERESEMFSDPPKINCETLQMIGVVFGKNIVEDLNTMQWKMFSSIADLYSCTLQAYIEDSFECEKHTIFAVSVCKGIVVWGTDNSSYYLAQMLHEKYYIDSSDEDDDYIDQLYNDPETSFFMNSNLF